MLVVAAIAGFGLFGAARREASRGRIRPVTGDRAAASDEQLLAWSVAGDRAAFDHLAGRHLERSYRIALRILGRAADAEDVAQEAMVRVWQNAARFDPERARFSTWCYRIIVNLALSRLRQPATLDLDAALDVADPGEDAPTKIAASETRGAIAAALEAMPARQRTALALVYYEQMSAADAAEVLEISPRALEGLLRRGRQFVRERLAENDGDASP